MKLRVLLLYGCGILPFSAAYPQSSAGSSPATPLVGAVMSTPGRIDYYPGTVNTTNVGYDSAFRLAIHLQPGQLIHLATLVRIRRGQLLGKLLYENKPGICRDHTPNLESDTAKLPIWDIDFVAGDFKPGCHYSVVLFEGVSSKIFSLDDDKSLLDAYYLAVQAHNAGPRYADAKAKYNELDDNQNNKFGYSAMDNFQSGYDFYENSIYPTHLQYYMLLPTVNDNGDIHGLIRLNDFTGAADCIENLYERIKASNSNCKGGSGSPCDSICRALSILYALDLIGQDADATTFGDFMAGRISLDDVLKSSLDIKRATTLQAELNNVQISFRDLTLLDAVLYGYGLVSPDNSCLDHFLDQLSDALTKKSNDLTQLLKYKKTILDKLNSGPTINFYDVQVEDLNSNILNFQTRTSLYFTPVFGYATYKFGNTYDFSPYLGFQVNLQPMNQNVKFRDIRYKTAWQRLTFVTAWTLKSVAYPGKRQDFFGNSSSLLTGVGFKLSHFVMLNASTLWFKALDANPYSTQKNFVCVPSISLTVNLSVSNILNGFTTLIPSL